MTDAVRLKTRSAARRVSLSAVICALSVITPQIFHLVGGQVAGNAFLPMHIPVLLGGFLLPPVLQWFAVRSHRCSASF